MAESAAAGDFIVEEAVGDGSRRGNAGVPGIIPVDHPRRAADANEKVFLQKVVVGSRG